MTEMPFEPFQFDPQKSNNGQKILLPCKRRTKFRQLDYKYIHCMCVNIFELSSDGQEGPTVLNLIKSSLKKFWQKVDQEGIYKRKSEGVCRVKR